MTEFLDEFRQIVDVRVVEDKTRVEVKPKQPRAVRDTFRTFSLSNTGEPQMLLGRAPNRLYSILQFTSAGPIVLGATRASVVAQNSDVAQINVAAAGPIRLVTTEEVWAHSTVAGATNCAVIAEYEEK